MYPNRFLAIFFVVLSFLSTLHARSFRVALLPNGSENTCANCHINPRGAGARTPFGEAVNLLVSVGGRETFWSPGLAAADSDGDGIPNGLELGDPDGDGTPLDGVEVSNPGIVADFPSLPGYRQNFEGVDNGATDLADGSGMSSSTGDTFVTGGALQLTSKEGLESNGIFKSPELGFDDSVTSFTLRFDLTLDEDEGGNPPADGFSVNVGPIDPDASVGTPGAAEEGFEAGLSVEFDTWDNANDIEEGEFGIGIDVSVDGVTAENGRARIDSAEDRNNNSLFKFDGVNRPVEIHWRADGGGEIDVLVDENFVFQNLAVPGYVPSADDLLAISGRTGGASETVLFDNLAINSPASPPLLSDPFINVAASVSFDPIEVSQSGEGVIALSNRGGARDLIISSATLGGINPDSFEVLTDLPLSLAPGASGEIRVRAVGGDTLGPLRAELTLVTNDQNVRRQSVVVSVSANVIPQSVGAAIYAQDFDSFGEGETDLADGSIIFSNNNVAKVSNGRFQLTENGATSSNAWWKLPPLGAQSAQGWVAIFDLALEASGTPADGFSLNFGAIPDEGNPGGAYEEGWGTGLAIEFDTWNNDGEGADNGIGIDVSVDGFSEETWLNRVEGGADPRDNDIYKFDGVSRLVVVRYEQTGEETGVLNLTYGDLEIFTDLEITGFTPEADHRFAFAGRTGGASESVLFDNVVFIAPPVDTGVYRQDFSGFEDGARDLGDGSFLASTPEDLTSVQGGTLQLTEDMVTSAKGFYLLPSLGEAQASGFTASFDYALFETPGGNAPADGFSFNLGAFGEEIPAGAEEGLGGLAVEFDTWDNADASEEGEFGIGIDVSIGGQTLEGGRLRVDANADPNSNEVFQFDGSFHKVTVAWERLDGVGQLSVILDGEPIFANLPTGDYSPAATDRFAFVGRTGGATETVLIDNVVTIAPGIPVRAGRDPRIASNRTLGLSAEANSSSTAVLQVVNEGFSQELTISEVGIEGDQAASFEVITQAPIVVPVGGVANIEVRYLAGATIAARDQAQLFLVSNDSSPQARRRLVDLIGVTTVPGGAYAQNFDAFSDGTTELDDGSILNGNTESLQIVDGRLQLTESGVGNANANFKVPPLGAGGTQAFVATFDYALFHADDADPINPADGFSFAFGDIGDTDTGSEEGYGTGLTIEFDTWDNEGEEGEFGIGIDASVDGVTIEGGTNRIAEDADRRDNELFVFDGSTRKMEVLWFRTGESDGLLTVTMDGQPLFENLPTPGFDPQAQYRFAFAARTGGATETVQIDNLNIVTGNEDPNLFAPAAFDVGLVQPGEGARVLMVPLRNTGQETVLNISNVALTSSVPGVFALQGNQPDMIAPFSAGVIAVAFDPAMATGLVTGEITVTSNDPSEPTLVIALSASVPLSGDLVAWYPLDETSGDLMDASGNGRNGSFIGDVAFGQGALATGSSVQFTSGEGTAAYASIPDFPALQTLTVSLWAQVTGLGPESSMTLVSKSNPDQEAAYSLSLFPTLENTLGVVAAEDPNNLSAPATGQSLATPSHIVLVHEDANGADAGAVSTRLYVNGVEVALSDSPPGFADVEDVLQIGARIGTSGFVGLLDDVQIYSRALSATEVTELFENPGMPIGTDGGPGPGGDPDSDKDGVSDADEALAGTDANDPSDYFRPIEVGNAADGFSFTFSSVAGRSYSIEHAETLSADGWVKIADVDSAGALTSFTDTDQTRLSGRGGYYRAVTQ